MIVRLRENERMLDNATDAPYDAGDALADAVDVLTLWRPFVYIIKHQAR